MDENHKLDDSRRPSRTSDVVTSKGNILDGILSLLFDQHAEGSSTHVITIDES